MPWAEKSRCPKRPVRRLSGRPGDCAGHCASCRKTRSPLYLESGGAGLLRFPSSSAEGGSAKVTVNQLPLPLIGMRASLDGGARGSCVLAPQVPYSVAAYEVIELNRHEGDPPPGSCPA
jgi:hypothetical protein